MNDIVIVGSKYWDMPSVQLVRKINGIVTMTGEKLHEKQFIDAVGERRSVLPNGCVTVSSN